MDVQCWTSVFDDTTLYQFYMATMLYYCFIKGLAHVGFGQTDPRLKETVAKIRCMQGFDDDDDYIFNVKDVVLDQEAFSVLVFGLCYCGDTHTNTHARAHTRTHARAHTYRATMDIYLY